jgi:hypothetical protein
MKRYRGHKQNSKKQMPFAQATSGLSQSPSVGALDFSAFGVYVRCLIRIVERSFKGTLTALQTYTPFKICQ